MLKPCRENRIDTLERRERVVAPREEVVARELARGAARHTEAVRQALGPGRGAGALGRTAPRLSEREQRGEVLGAGGLDRRGGGVGRKKASRRIGSCRQRNLPVTSF